MSRAPSSTVAAGLAQARRVLPLEAMAGEPTDEGAEFARLMRRADAIVRHHRFHQQPIDARDVVDRVLAGSGPDGEPLARWRGPLREAVAALMHGLR